MGEGLLESRGMRADYDDGGGRGVCSSQEKEVFSTSHLEFAKEAHPPNRRSDSPCPVTHVTTYSPDHEHAEEDALGAVHQHRQRVVAVLLVGQHCKGGK